MKKFFAILIVALLATSFAFSQGSASGSGVFTATVITPITLTVTGDFDLGIIAAGDTKPLTGKYITFTVGGHTGQGFTTPGITGPVIGGVATDATLTEGTGSWSAGGTAVPDAYTLPLTALNGGALTGGVTFTYSMTVTYTY